MDCCRRKRLAQSGQWSKSEDNAWQMRTRPAEIASCYDHYLYTKMHFPNRQVKIDGHDCYFCNVQMPQDDMV
jgi:hypothetical protein